MDGNLKKILFYYDNFCGANSRGGTEVATFRIAAALHDTGEFLVFDAFRRGKIPESHAPYKAIVRLSRSDNKFIERLSGFINACEIDYIVNMSRFFRHHLIKKAIIRSGRNVRLLFMHHFAPGSEKKKSTFSAGIHLLKFDPFNPLYWLRSSLYPLLKLPRFLNYDKKYREVYDLSDRIVLLSEGYILPYKKIARLNESSKFVAIPNIFDSTVNPVYKLKEKRVLVLSRADEVQNRLSLALKIWHKIEQRSDFSDWHLDIVGSGHDIGGVRRMAKSLGLKNITFHGWQDPKFFLERSSILMMTSEYEGLPLSILEARAYGCVPVAFDSFASLRDVITDGENGIIINRFGDVDDFTRKLAELMGDEKKRINISQHNDKMEASFSSEVIANRWKDMLSEIG